MKGLYFTGLIKKDNYHFAEREKVVADYLYLSPGNSRARKLEGLDMEDVNQNRLQTYLKKMAITNKTT